MLTSFKQSHSFLANSARLACKLRKLSVRSRGFTLVEMLVVVGVISIITLAMLFSQNKFSSSTLLRSLSYSVALTIRQAQLYGSSVRGFTSAGVTQFAPGYGSYIAQNALGKYTLYLFADINGNSAYDIGEVVSTSNIGTGYTISKFCGLIAGSAVEDCYPSGVNGGGTLSTLTVYFRRPLSDATFSAACIGTCGIYNGAFVEIKSNGNNDFRAVKVTNTGQITVCTLNNEPPTNC